MANTEARGTTHFATAVHIRHLCEQFTSASDLLYNVGNKMWRKENIGSMVIDEFVDHAEKDKWKPFRKTYFRSFVVHMGNFTVDRILCQEQWEEGISRLHKSLALMRGTKYSGKVKLHYSHERCSDLSQALERAS